jgi:two-component system sensor kinase FixL
MIHARLIERSGAENRSILGSAVVHEVSQPLLAVNAYADGLEKLIASRTELPVEFAEAAASIRLAANHAREIITNCKSLLATGPNERTPAKLSDVLRSTELLIRMHPAAAGVRLTWDLAPGLEAVLSSTQVQQVLLNLAVNGLQAMQSVTSPVLAISSARWANAAVVSVADCGHGVAKDLREQIFEPSMSRREGGTGLGLYLSRLIVTAHGGRIWADGNPGGGSIFRFTIPLDVSGDN